MIGPVVARAHLLTERNWAITLACFAAGLVALVGFLAGTARYPWLVMPALFFATSSLGLGALLGRPRRGRPSKARIDEHGITLDEQSLATRAAIASAIVLSGFGEVRVRILLRSWGLGRSFSLAVDDVQTAREIVRALGFDTRSTAVGFQTASRISESNGAKVVIALFGLLALVFGDRLGVNGFALSWMTVTALFLAALLSPTRVVVGADGVHLRWIAWKRFIPLSDIVRVEQMPARVRLHLRPNAPLAPSIDVFFRGREARVVPEAMMIAERLREALDRKLEHHAVLDASLLARPAGPASLWVKALATLSREETFREAGVHAGQLWEVVEDATMDVARRAAAATALRPFLDDEGRTRLRIAARTTAAPRLRVALETVATGDDDAVAAALDELTVHEATHEGA